MAEERKSREEREKDVRDAVALFWRRHTASPSAAQIAELCGMSGTNYVAGICADMIRRGRLVHVGKHGYMLASDQATIREALRGTSWR